MPVTRNIILTQLGYDFLYEFESSFLDQINSELREWILEKLI
jgi:hypothetical protein